MRASATVQAGGDDFLVKPVPPALLVSSVAARLERARFLNMLLSRDGLTQLLTHTYFMEQVEAVVLRRRREPDVPATLVMLDIDHFKSINDAHGHQAGDRALRALAALLRRHVRRSDPLGRYGGEEFAILLDGVHERDATAPDREASRGVRRDGSPRAVGRRVPRHFQRRRRAVRSADDGCRGVGERRRQRALCREGRRPQSRGHRSSGPIASDSVPPACARLTADSRRVRREAMEHDHLRALVERSQLEFVAGFAADYNRLIDLAGAAGAGDSAALVELQLAAHRLVGRAGIVQFLSVARHAAALETLARVDAVRHFDRGAAAACLVELRDAFVEARAALSSRSPGTAEDRRCRAPVRWCSSPTTTTISGIS